jgi:hypothetical protein
MNLGGQVKLDLTTVKEPVQVLDIAVNDPVRYVLLRKV